MIHCFKHYDKNNMEPGLFLMNFLLHTSGQQKFESVLGILAVKLSEEESEQKNQENLTVSNTEFNSQNS